MGIKKIGIIGHGETGKALLAAIELAQHNHSVEVVMIGAGPIETTHTDTLAIQAIEAGCDILIHGDELGSGTNLEEVIGKLSVDPLPYKITEVNREFVETWVEPKPNKYFGNNKKNWKK